ncbi:CAP domain-containing protein [Imhoffiella purpurea]|uniref:SCP domain-containing protein n=1 Tax=Imhoffiella purpurea TaxID=1249627 RepID=W9V8R3_9GAMM|nr:CAP domain-containing protein [Imhoffiella purpurea]EXJ15804.1 hypothetical protein D779_1028 [Imhoffiella purpurea]
MIETRRTRSSRAGISPNGERDADGMEVSPNPASRFLWRHTALLGLCSLLIGGIIGLAPSLAQEGGGTVPNSPTGLDDAQLSTAADEIVARTNAFRRANDLDPLHRNETLARTSQSFADFMARTDRYGHHADGSSPAARAKRHGYDYCVIAENIAYAYSSAGLSRPQVVDTSMKGWRESPGHRENMLDPDVTQIGVAAARSDSSERIYLVQMFGRPNSQRIGFQIENLSSTKVEYSLGDQRYPLRPGHTRLHRRCRDEPLRIHWPDRAEDRTLDPVDDGQYRIESAASGDLQLLTQ